MVTLTVSKRMRIWVIAVAVLTPLFVTGLNVWYTNTVDARSQERNNYQQREADARWCALLNVLTDPSAAPPTTERGRDILKAELELYASLRCKRP